MGGPVSNSYQVAERLFAGEYPANDWEPSARARMLARFTDFGITDFIDLTDNELFPYESFLPDGCRRHVFPIKNRGVPESHEVVDGLMNMIDDLLGKGWTVYIHCHGGIGRTGMIVACYFRHKGMSGEDALREMRRRFSTTPNGRWYSSPENQEQVDFVMNSAGK